MNLSRTSLRHQELIWLILCVALGLTLRFSAIGTFSHMPESDELNYHSMALNLISGNGIVDALGNHAFFNVGYPLFVLAPVFAIFGDDLLIVQLLNALLGGLAIVLCYVTAKEAGAGKIGRLLATALWAGYLPASVYTVYLFKENLMAPLMLGVIWCAIRLAKEPTYITAVGCGVLFGLIALTGNAALSLAAPVALALVVTSAKPRRKLVLFMSIVITALFVAAPWMVRNMHVLGSPLLNTNGGFNLYIGNNPAATGVFVSISDTPRGDTWRDLRAKGEVLASETLKGEAIAWIKENPTAFTVLALKKAVLFWTPPFHQGEGQASRAESIVRVLWLIQFIVLLAGALASAFIKGLWRCPIAVLWLAIAGYTAAHMLFYVIFRYREPIMPQVCILAAMTFEFLLNRWKIRSNRSYAV